MKGKRNFQIEYNNTVSCLLWSSTATYSAILIFTLYKWKTFSSSISLAKVIGGGRGGCWWSNADFCSLAVQSMTRQTKDLWNQVRFSNKINTVFRIPTSISLYDLPKIFWKIKYNCVYFCFVYGYLLVFGVGESTDATGYGRELQWKCSLQHYNLWCPPRCLPI